MSLVSHVEAATRSCPQVPWSSSPQRYEKTKGTIWNVRWATHLKLGKESLTIHAKKQTLAERTLNEECTTASASSFQDQLQELRLQCLGIAMCITLIFLSRLYTPHSVITICWPFQWHGRLVDHGSRFSSQSLLSFRSLLSLLSPLPYHPACRCDQHPSGAQVSDVWPNAGSKPQVRLKQFQSYWSFVCCLRSLKSAKQCWNSEAPNNWVEHLWPQVVA